MKTWRERIAAARERGHFTVRDHNLICDFQTCMVGEASAPLGKREDRPWQHFKDLEMMGYDLGWPNQEGPAHSVRENDFDLAERLLEAIEDKVLDLKRNLSS